MLYSSDPRFQNPDDSESDGSRPAPGIRYWCRSDRQQNDKDRILRLIGPEDHDSGRPRRRPGRRLLAARRRAGRLRQDTYGQGPGYKLLMGEGFRRSLEWFLARRGDREEQFKIAEKKIMSQTKFPPEFELPVNMSMVHLQVIRPWIAKRVRVLIPHSRYLTSCTSNLIYL